jgi:hypothetical protein
MRKRECTNAASTRSHTVQSTAQSRAVCAAVKRIPGISVHSVRIRAKSGRSSEGMNAVKAIVMVHFLPDR